MKRIGRYLALAAVVVAGLCLLCSCGSHNLDKQLQNADQALENEDYEKAQNLFQQILQDDAEHVQARIGLSKAYLALGKTNDAENTLVYLVNKDTNEEAVYRALYDLYDQKRMKDKMFSLFTQLDAKQNNALSSLRPASPAVTPESGTYNDAQTVDVTPALGTIVYYTTDGSAPALTSPVFRIPLKLTEGVYSYNFVAVDEKGVPSAVKNMNYTLEKLVLNATLFSYLGETKASLTEKLGKIKSESSFGYLHANADFTVSYDSGDLLTEPAPDAVCIGIFDFPFGKLFVSKSTRTFTQEDLEALFGVTSDKLYDDLGKEYYLAVDYNQTTVHVSCTPEGTFTSQSMCWIKED